MSQPRSTDPLMYLRQLLRDLEIGEKSIRRGRIDITNCEIVALKSQIASLERRVRHSNAGSQDV
jgi:hypothetical protein